LQNTLDYSAINKNLADIEPQPVMHANSSLLIKPLSPSSANYISSVGSAFLNHNNHVDEIEAIDQQFDEVLRFLAQSINEQTALSAPSSTTSSPSAISLIQNSNHLKKDRSSGSSSSSNSSGIGDDFESSSTIKSKTQSNESKHQVQFEQQQIKKRNSTDSAFLETISMPSSNSLTAIEANKKHINKSKNQQADFNVNGGDSSTFDSSNPSPNSQTSKDSNDIMLIEKSLNPVSFLFYYYYVFQI